MLEHLISTQGTFRKAVYRYDAMAALNRMFVTQNPNEMSELSRDQMLMVLIAGDDQSESERWKFVEERHGPIVV